ncbi:MAG TPA: 4Fe-4S dicluster domain-containing protein [bacterium]|nr:4Fe-4S dicluster domain-containing protein [bacterium]HQP97184.1 4Fe-4S dicluster domain-containing protein [bacterium]
MTETLEWKDIAFLREVERRSGTPVSACFQCHKCSTGCPIGAEMEFLSSQIMRLIHLGEEEKVLKSHSIWLCASCEACTTRCPMGIDIAGVMDILRIMAVERKLTDPRTRGETFHRSFLSSVRRHGRVFELGMLTAYKLRCADFLTDLDKAPKLWAKGKLSLLPKRSADVAEVKEIFRKAEEEEKNR